MSNKPEIQIKNKKAIIIGCGIAGLTAAIALEKIGYDVHLFESSDNLRTSGTGLSIMANAVSALKHIGIEGLVENAGQVMESFQIKTPEGKKITSFPIKEVCDQLGSPCVNIHREKLHNALRSRVLKSSIFTDKPCVGYREGNESVFAIFADGSEEEGDILIGADGFNSVIRKQLLGEQAERSVPYIAWLATVNFSHPILKPGYVAHYWGNGKRFGLIDIGHGQAYWWGTHNVPNPRDAVKKLSKQEVLNTYKNWANEVQEIINLTPESSILKVHTRDREPIDTWGKNRVTLIGDSAHPMLASLGQGAGQAIEDAVILSHYLKDNPIAIDGLRQYEAHRLPKANKIVNTARFMSNIEQIPSPLLQKIRNLYFRFTPQSVFKKQNKEILKFQMP